MKASRLLTMFALAGSMLLVACGETTPTVQPTEPDKPSETTTETKPSETTTEEKPSETTTEVPPATGPFIKEPTKITFWNTFSYASQIENIIAKFKEIEPNITVENKKQTGSYTDLKDMTIKGIPANNYPDLVVAYPDHVAEYLDAGVAIDLDPYMDDKNYGWTRKEKNDVVYSFLEEGQKYPVPGTYSMPMAKSTEAMFYNEKLLNVDLKKYDASINGGLPISHDYLNNLTWEEMFNKLCPALVKYNNDLPENEKLLKTDLEFHAIMGYDSDDNLFITLAEQYGYPYTHLDNYGVGHIDFVNDGMKNLMKTFNKAYKDGYIMSKGTVNGKYVNTFFTAQNCLFSVGSTGGVKYQHSKTFNVGVAKIPHAEGHEPKVINQGPSVAFLDHKDENRALATWLFYKFLTNEQNSLYWSLETGYMPIRESNYESEDYLAYCSTEDKDPMSPELLTAKNATYVGTVSDDLFVSAVFKGSSEAREQAGALMTNSLREANMTDEWLDGKFDAAYANAQAAM